MRTDARKTGGGWGLWRMLRLDELLERSIESGREEMAWSTMAAILAIARLCEPSIFLRLRVQTKSVKVLTSLPIHLSLLPSAP